MALIGHGSIEADEVPSFTSFDHVIGAVQLKESLGLPAEVETPQGRFLLVDPTSRFTPLGQLPAYFLDQRVMICTPGGATWVKIPASAVQSPACVLTLEGEVDASRGCRAVLTVQETADQLGLRDAMVEKDRKGLRERLVTFLDLPPSASLDLSSVGDPLDLSRPFSVSAAILQPEALRREGGDEVLVAWGLPAVPRAIQRSGQARQFPIQDWQQGHLEFRATYHMPFPVTPLLPALDVENPFRSLHWTAQAGKAGDPRVVTLAFSQERRPAFFGFSMRDQGLLAWKKDRNAVLRLRNDGLAFTRVN
jgi:hypothetical protein